MRIRRRYVFAICLVVIVLLLAVGGPLLTRLGVQPICIQGAWPNVSVVRCGTPVRQPSPLLAAPPLSLSAGAHPVIIDTDMAPDDWMAIMYLLRHAGVDVKAITVSGTGEVRCAAGVRNARNLAALAGRPGIPVACGRETPLKGNHQFPREWRDWADALAGISLPGSAAAPSSQDAVQLLSSAIGAASSKVTVVTLGPLTNLAEAFAAGPALAGKIGMLYAMGGAFRVDGNIANSRAGIDNKAAEWNTYIDPYAANVVLRSGAPVTFVPLDATNHVPVNQSFYNRLAQARKTSCAEFVYQTLTAQMNRLPGAPYWFWDPLAAAISTDESLATFENAAIKVIEDEGPEVGATRSAADGTPARFATSAARAQFEALFLDVLNRE